MALFDYSGFDHSGARVQGTFEADSLASAKAQLQQRGVLLSDCAERKERQAALWFGSQKVSLTDIEFFTSELSVLLEAGLKIDKGVELLRVNNSKPALLEMLTQLTKSLRSGKQLSAALAEFPQYFDALYINLVQIGEESGRLSDVFRSLSVELSYRRDLRQKVLQSLSYPIVILCVCIASILFIFNYVVPNMSAMFAGRENLPYYTEMLLGLSGWIQQYQFYVLIGLCVCGGLISKYRQHPWLTTRWQRLQLKLPVVSTACLMVERVRFSGSLAMMLDSGIAIDNAMQLSCGNIRNQQIAGEIRIAIEKVKRGESLSTSLKQSRLFPVFFASLLAVGEESGELGKIFNEIAQRSRREFDNWVSRFTSLLEPLLILVMGGIVGSVVVIMMLSITNVTEVNF